VTAPVEAGDLQPGQTLISPQGVAYTVLAVRPLTRRSGRVLVELERRADQTRSALPMPRVTLVTVEATP
jgi:hypothetical protein